MRSAAALISLCISLCVAGCSSGTPAPAEETVEPTLTSIVQKVFAPRCATSGCHSIDLPREGLALHNEEATLLDTVNVPPKTAGAAAQFPALIVPGDPDRSFLYAKIIGPPAGLGLRMPNGGGALSAQATSAIRTWIASMKK